MPWGPAHNLPWQRTRGIGLGREAQTARARENGAAVRYRRRFRGASRALCAVDGLFPLADLSRRWCELPRTSCMTLVLRRFLRGIDLE